MKSHNFLSSLFAFLHALASAGELKSINRFCQLIKLAKSWHARARRVDHINARNDRHVKIQSGCFRY